MDTVERFYDLVWTTDWVDAGLTLREQAVVGMRFGLRDGNRYTLTEVGQDISRVRYGSGPVSPQRVAQIQNKAVRKLLLFTGQERVA